MVWEWSVSFRRFRIRLRTVTRAHGTRDILRRRGTREGNTRVWARSDRVGCLSFALGVTLKLEKSSVYLWSLSTSIKFIIKSTGLYRFYNNKVFISYMFNCSVKCRLKKKTMIQKVKVVRKMWRSYRVEPVT